ncbi:MAG: AlwI family type II restriction endonuclease [Bacteroidaceae bacterium]|nr:AlwI family type II restriction endonuclease [Bacteroidaceae bacterium]
MARIDSQLLFLTTSPRTPEKMIPEINLLIKNFSGQVWNPDSQRAFMEVLRNEDFYNGQGANDPAFSARDRINRAPKSLGFVLLKPTLQLTPAGHKLLTSRRTDEVFLRQMLKFQVPSPYHKPTDKAAEFCVKPYLEMLRLVRTMGTLRFDELQMFGMQLTDYHDFDNIVNKIEQFRIAKAQHVGSYRNFKTEYFNAELRRIYSERIQRGETKTRESNDASLANFLRTQSRNMRDYADACFRYLRITGLVNVSHVGKSLTIVPERIADVDYILQNVNREPVFVEDNAAFTSYLGNADLPRLLTDDRQMLEDKIHAEFPSASIAASTSIDELKDLLADLFEQRKRQSITEQVAEIKDYRQYNDIQEIYDKIEKKEIFDAPLMLEWNTWRAMTMLDGGDIQANLNFDDYGQPLSTAAGNMSDIVCDYGDYMVCVEVTMASGQKQYEMEGEPVTRHLGKLKAARGKPCYCLFVAPIINDACVTHFYMAHHLNLKNYGGKSTIIPLPLQIFRKMVEDSYKANYTPNPSHVRSFFEASNEYAKTCENDMDWYEKMKEKALHWLE